jgi:hypothetical protein
MKFTFPGVLQIREVGDNLVIHQVYCDMDIVIGNSDSMVCPRIDGDYDVKIRRAGVYVLEYLNESGEVIHAQRSMYCGKNETIRVHTKY